MSNARRLHYSYDEYLRLLEQSSIKLEYSAGVIYAMAGGSRAHAALAAAMIATLRNALRRSCTVFTSDPKIRIDQLDVATFPDVSVVCGEQQISTRDPNALINPTLIVEVTSPSTEDYDRGEKLESYKKIPSLRAVLFVSHTARSITVVHRDGAQWITKDERATVSLESPAVTFAVADIYDGVALGEG